MRAPLEKFDRTLRFLYLVPIVISVALIAQDYIPESLFGGSPQAGVWSIAGSLSATTFGIVYRKLKAIGDEDGLNIKVFNDKIKLLSSSINAIALACVVAAFVNPILGTENSIPKLVVFLLLAVFSHVGAQRFLTIMVPEK